MHTDIHVTTDEQKDFAPETVLVQTLTDAGLTLSCAESCTGGLICQRITNVPGASAALAGGCVTYTNRVKELLLGVKPETICAHTAVSAEVAAEMAQGICSRLGTDLALSATGYAGPGGGTEKDPVGTVYIGLAVRDEVETFRLAWPSDQSRAYIREASATFALRKALEAARKLQEASGKTQKRGSSS